MYIYISLFRVFHLSALYYSMFQGNTYIILPLHYLNTALTVYYNFIFILLSQASYMVRYMGIYISLHLAPISLTVLAQYISSHHSPLGRVNKSSVDCDAAVLLFEGYFDIAMIHTANTEQKNPLKDVTGISRKQIRGCFPSKLGSALYYQKYYRLRAI